MSEKAVTEEDQTASKISAEAKVFGMIGQGDGGGTSIPGFQGDSEGLPLPAPPLINEEFDDNSEVIPPKIFTKAMGGMMERLSSPSKSRRGSTHSTGNPSTVMFMQPEEGTPAAAALAANAELKMSKTDKILHKLRGMKRPKMKALNVMKQLKKKTKVKGRKKYKNFKGKVIDGEHELYVITAGIILGIRCSLENSKLESMTRATRLTLEDFNYVENVAFPASGSDGLPYPTPPHSLQRTFKFKSYAPRVFSRLRDLVDINADEYLESICGSYNFIEFMSNSKSGQFFFYSHDGKYMLKTQTKEENKFMKLILPHYYRYLAENPQSMLVRFLGMHRVKMYQFRRKVHFVIMTSVFNTPEEIHTIYDLKGSTIGREATAKEKASGGVMKDLDLINRGEKFHLGCKRDVLLDQLDKDAAFLASLGIMDYSLLIGIHYRSRRQKPTLSRPVSMGGSASELLDGAETNNIESEEGMLSSLPPGEDKDSTDYLPNDGSMILPMTSHSNTPLRRALAADGGPHSRNASFISQSPSRSGSIHTKSGKSKSTAKKAEDSIGRDNIYDVEEEEDEEDSDDDTDSQFSEESDTGSVTEDMISQAQKDSRADPTFYSDSKGLKSSEGERLSQILSLRGVESPVMGASSRKKLGLQSYRGLKALSERRIKVDIAIQEEESQLASKKMAAASYLRDEGDSDEEEGSDEAEGGEKVGKGKGNNNELSLMEDASKLPRPAARVKPSGEKSSSHMRFDARHPWTTRKDLGINSRLAGTNQRGDEIYYCGIIDILQLYNMHKAGETLLKSLWQDSTKISSVDPHSYAKRFVEFLEDHTD